MKPGLRRFALTAHVASSVGWLGAAVAYFGLVLAALISEDADTVRAAYLAMEPLTWFALVPLAVASLLTGLAQGLGTQWGLLRHYWVVFKLLLSVFATTVLLLNTRTVSSLADVAAEAESVGRGGLHGQLLHSGGGALLLVVICVAIVTLIAPATRSARLHRRPVDRGTQVQPLGVLAPTDSPLQARASPGWLQRFLN